MFVSVSLGKKLLESRSTNQICRIIFGFAVLQILSLSAFAAAPINTRMVSFLADNVGKQVGAGECAHLASEAIRVAGGEFIHDLVGADSPNPGDYVWGTAIGGYVITKGKLDGLFADVPQVGDVLQYSNVRFSTGATATHHTSIIAKVDSTGAPLEVYEQNFGNNRFCARNKVDFKKMTAGMVQFYRAKSRFTNVSGRRQFSVVNRSSDNKSKSLTYVIGTSNSSSFTVGVPNTENGYSTRFFITSPASAKLSLKTSSGSSVEIIDGAGYEVIGGSSPTIRRLNP